MFAFVFLLLSIFFGYVLIKTFLPRLGLLHADGVHHWMVLFPASFSVGVIFSGWITYATAFLTRESGRALFNGTLLTILLLVGVCNVYLWRHWKSLRPIASLQKLFSKTPLLFFTAVFVFVCWLMIHTFFVSDGNFNMGYTIYSDFAAHTALIRSFSYGSNFPTNYPHFPDGTMRYHFMFQFYTGVLEYLGLRMDHAFNLMSVVSLFNAAVLLYVLALLLTGKKAVGFLSVLFLFFRSSFSGLLHIIENAPYKGVGEFIAFVRETGIFIGKTPNESWGLWNINVYANQRHFALGISVLLIGVLAVLPHVRNMPGKGWLLAKDSWLGENYKSAGFIGVFIGAATFFNGACVIALLAVLAGLALFSKHRLEFAIIAAIAMLMSFMGGNFFAPGVSLADPKIVFGFIAEDKSAAGVARYIVELTGVCIAAAVFGTITNWKKLYVFLLAFSLPFVLTFTLSLTPDVTVNHKYLMLSVMLMNILVAYGVSFLWEHKWMGKTIAVILTVLLIHTGVFDLMSENNMNGMGRSAAIPVESRYQTWIKENTKPGEIFLTNWDALSEIFFAGRYEFMGWPYYAWSAGYDTFGRADAVRSILGAASPEELKRLAGLNHVSYIVITPDLLGNTEFPTNIQNIAASCPLVYSEEAVQLYVYKIIE